MSSWQLASPGWLLALLALGAVAWLRRRRRLAAFVVPHAVAWRRSAAAPIARWPAALSYLSLALLVFALARPQRLEEVLPEKRAGYDIVLAIDLSTSMYAEDFHADGRTLNRLQTVKPIIEAFINRRPDDRIGVVVFAGRAYTFAPLTFDHDWLRRQTGRLAIGAVEDGTAIGDALGVSLARLQQGARRGTIHAVESRPHTPALRATPLERGPKPTQPRYFDPLSRGVPEGRGVLDASSTYDARPGDPDRLGAYIVLLTDGASNRGSLDPRQAADLVAENGVAVYAIGAGADGMVPMPVFDAQGRRTGTEMRRSEIDDLLLRDVAEQTGGLYFRATDARALEESFTRIDEATRNELAAPPRRVTRELFGWCLAAGAPGLAFAALGTIAQGRREGIA